MMIPPSHSSSIVLLENVLQSWNFTCVTKQVSGGLTGGGGGGRPNCRGKRKNRPECNVDTSPLDDQSEFLGVHGSMNMYR